MVLLMLSLDDNLIICFHFGKPDRCTINVFIILHGFPMLSSHGIKGTDKL